MTSPYPIPEMTPHLADPEGAVIHSRDAKPLDEALAEAEDDEMVELWAGDRGNQGA